MLRGVARTRDGGRLAIEAAVKAGNTRTDSAHNRYQIAPVELVKIEREARSEGLSIGGFYHSHPDHPAQWSPDRFCRGALAGLLLRHNRGGEGQGNSDQLVPAGRSTPKRDKRFEDEAIEVIERTETCELSLQALN